MSLSIPDNFITDLNSFTWDKDWRATRIIKEKRTDGDYYFANIVKYYGEKEESSDYDIGDTHAEMAWLGRNEKFVGKRIHDTDHESPTFGKRIYTPARVETIIEENTGGKPISREVLVEGKTIYEYTIKVNADNTKKMRSLAGAIALNQDTKYLFVYGAVPPLIVDAETFWDVSVKGYLDSIKPVQEIKTRK